MQLTITIPDVQLKRVLDGVAWDNNYQATVADPKDNTKTIPNTETKAQFVKRMLVERLKGMVKGGEQKQADENAKATLNQTELDII